MVCSKFNFGGTWYMIWNRHMKFDTDIIFDYLPDIDKKSFMVWNSIFLSNSGNIVATYRAPFEEKVIIPLNEYEKRVKQKERDIKLNKLC